MKKEQLSGKALQTKNRIIEAARKLFMENGYDGTTLREIAKMTHVTTGAIYKYFASKDEILIWLFSEGFKEQWKHFYDLEENFTPIDYIAVNASMNKGIAETFGPEMLKVYFSSLWSVPQDKFWKAIDDENYHAHDFCMIKSMIDRYSESYTAEQFEEITLAVERGVFYQWILNKGGFDIEEATRELLTLTLKGILTKFTEW